MMNDLVADVLSLLAIAVWAIGFAIYMNWCDSYRSRGG